jgi:hypothetical protein
MPVAGVGWGMSWHYQVRRRSYRDEFLYDIVENFGKPFGYTHDSVAPLAESKAGLIKALKAMIRDAERYRVIREKETL